MERMKQIKGLKIGKQMTGAERKKPEGMGNQPGKRKGAKRTAALLTVLCLSFGLAGCGTGQAGSLKDNLLDGFNRFLQSFSRNALTEDRDLQGERVSGEDAYTGSYAAEYEAFNGKEFLFGGTALRRERGSELEVTYTLEVTSGSAALYWSSSGEEHVIVEEDGEGVYRLTLGSGDNYIALEGEDFSGRLEMRVVDISAGT